MDNPISMDPSLDNDEPNISPYDFWVPVYNGEPLLNCTSSPCLNCTEWSQQPCSDTPIWRSWNFGLLMNGSYVETLIIGNENCTEGMDFMNYTDSVKLVVETVGSWVIDVNNTWSEGWDNGEGMVNNGVVIGTSEDDMVVHPEILMFDSDWYHVSFIPMWFNVTIFDDMDFYYNNVTDFYYGNMTDLYVNNMTEGFCMPILEYWNNETIGCPCNDTWDTTGYYNSSTNSFMDGRQIIPSQCPGDCASEMMFLNDTTKYANIRINVTTFNNGTVLKTLEFTKTSYNQSMGYTYGAQDIWYVFGAWNQGPVTSDPVISNLEITITIPEVAPFRDNDDNDDDVYYNGSNGLTMSTMITIIFIFLLSIIHPN
jgi:hypothetical protein